MHNQRLMEILHPKMTSIFNTNDASNDLKRAHLEISELRTESERLRDVISNLQDQISDNTYEKRLEQRIKMLEEKLLEGNKNG